MESVQSSIATHLPLRLRVFLSSPGDVSDERSLARQVLQDLVAEPAFSDTVVIKRVAWDDPAAPVAMAANLTPQDAINQERAKPSECDLVVVILWSRMGTPLPPEHRKPDGSTYRSGTEWEFLDAIQGAEANAGRPLVWVYRRTEEPSFRGNDPQLSAKLAQWQLVKDFFADFENEDGSLKRGYHSYPTPSEFHRLFEKQLRELIHKRLSALPAEQEPIPKDQKVTSDPTLKAAWQGNPYRGLNPFGPKDTAIFFGRGLETDELVKRVRDGVRVLAVIGASGSGKSSLVAAGLLPRLAGGAVEESGQWVQVRFTPAEQGGNPFRALAWALFPLLPAGKYTVGGLADALCGNLAEFGSVTEEVLAAQPAGAELLLFVDQFEALFTANVNDGYRQPFVNWVEAIAKSRRVRLVLTLRADYYEHCTRFETLAAIFRDGSFPLAAPTGRALTEMIERPAQAADIKVEAGLVDEILRDIGNRPGSLALMEFTLQQLFDLCEEAGVLSMTAYREALNRVNGAIERQANKAVGDGSADNNSLESLFDALSVVDPEGGAVRRRAWLDKLDKPSQDLAERLVTARLFTTDHDTETRRAWVEVAHEEVLRGWPAFKTWLDDHRNFKLWHPQFMAQMQRWRQAQISRTELLEGSRLREARFWQKRYPQRIAADERDFIRRSRLYSAMRAVGLLAAIVVLPVMIGLFYWWANDNQLTTRVGLQIGLVRLGVTQFLAPDMVTIPPQGDCTTANPCRFKMGSPEVHAYPPHEVAFSKPFRLGEHEVTFDEYEVFRLLLEQDGGCPEGHELEPRDGQDQGWGRGQRPVIRISWDDAQCYLAWLNRKTGAQPPYRLPTEAEWEYAARSGSTGPYYWGDSDQSPTEYAWYYENSQQMTHPVKQKKPNSYGLYDMVGNVAEWVQDCSHDNYEGAPKAGNVAWEEHGVTPCFQRVMRGGSWLSRPFNLRSANRFRDTPGNRYGNLGFRLAQDL